MNTQEVILKEIGKIRRMLLLRKILCALCELSIYLLSYVAVIKMLPFAGIQINYNWMIPLIIIAGIRLYFLLPLKPPTHEIAAHYIDSALSLKGEILSVLELKNQSGILNNEFLQNLQQHLPQIVKVNVPLMPQNARFLVIPAVIIFTQIILNNEVPSNTPNLNQSTKSLVEEQLKSIKNTPLPAEIKRIQQAAIKNQTQTAANSAASKNANAIDPQNNKSSEVITKTNIETTNNKSSAYKNNFDLNLKQQVSIQTLKNINAAEVYLPPEFIPVKINDK